MTVALSAGQLVPTEPRCESLTDPLGIDRLQPGFSWKLMPSSSGLRNLKQTAYRILVARDPRRLTPGKADLWDSGRVDSSDTYGVAYGGKPLTSGLNCWWKVQAWDQDGNPSGWSPAAKFSMGLLKPTDWKAKWIALDAPDRMTEEGQQFSGASWIWSAADPVTDVPPGVHTFVRTVAVPNDVESAVMYVTADDQFTLSVNGGDAAKSDGETDAWRRPVKVDLTGLVKPGDNELLIEATNSAKGFAGLIAKLVIRSKGGVEQTVVTDASWKEADGASARVVGEFGIEPWGRLGALILRGATYYRTELDVSKKLKRATAYVTALGLVDLHVNGKRVADDLFTPGWSDYDKRVYYRTYDVTKVLKPGANGVGAVLGDGWYSGHIGFGGRRGHYGDRPRVRVQIALEYSDGSRQTIGTSEKWKASGGPTIEQDFLAGETYDARKEEKGWDKAGFADSHWSKPYTVSDVKAKVESFPSDPVEPYQRLKPISEKELRPGVYLLDFGQNLAGFARLKVRERAGAEVKLRFGEWLNPDGTLYTTNLRGARATDHYICRGGGTEEWEPRFTFHGFQYTEVSGVTSAPEVEAVAISSATPETGTIETSDKLLNKVASNAWWTQKMNFIDIPTDCPQRDERLGWTGDAQAYIHTATLYSDCEAFFRKWLVALDDSQRADGQFPMVAPLKVAGGDGGPAWADAGVICPWTIYKVYGDKRELAEHFPNMKRFVDFCRKRSKPSLLPPDQFHCFGDWLNINAETPNEVIYEAYFAGSARIVAQAATALGNKDDAKKYGDLAQRVKAAFNKAYVSQDGSVKGDTQCAYVLALAFDLLDEPLAKKTANKLVKDIENRGWHLSTGFVGTRDLMDVLTKIGRNDVAFKLLHQTTFPSWKFEVLNGATSIWERWDGWTPDKGMQDPGMNSFAHYAYGAVMGWVFTQIGGVQNAGTGYDQMRIAPAIDPNLTWARTSYNSVRGKIVTSWKTAGGKLTIDVEVPPNVSAEVFVPVGSGGKVVTDVKGKRVKGGQLFAVGSGTYKFVASAP